MAQLEELATMLFGSPIGEGAETNGTKIIYGTALADSENGAVLVQLDTAIYASDDEQENDFLIVNITDDGDSTDAIDDEDEEEEDEEIVSWDMADDETTETDGE